MMGIPSVDSGSLGDFLKFAEIVSIIGTGVVLSFRIGRAAERFELIGSQQAKEISELKDAIRKIADAQTASISDRAQIATQAIQLAELRKELNLLRTGRGFIREAVNGEWPKE